MYQKLWKKTVSTVGALFKSPPPPVHPDAFQFMTFVLKVNTETPGWQKTLAKLLSKIRGIHKFRMSEDGLVEVYGLVLPVLLLKQIGKAGGAAQLCWFQFGQCSSNLFLQDPWSLQGYYGLGLNGNNMFSYGVPGYGYGGQDYYDYGGLGGGYNNLNYYGGENMYGRGHGGCYNNNLNYYGLYGDPNLRYNGHGGFAERPQPINGYGQYYYPPTAYEYGPAGSCSIM